MMNTTSRPPRPGVPGGCGAGEGENTMSKRPICCVCPICRVCGFPLEDGEARLDPEPPDARVPSYLHPNCAKVANDRLTERLALARARIEKAAPRLLSACQSLLALHATDPECYDADAPLRAVIAEARAAVAAALTR